MKDQNVFSRIQFFENFPWSWNGQLQWTGKKSKVKNTPTCYWQWLVGAATSAQLVEIEVQYLNYALHCCTSEVLLLGVLGCPSLVLLHLIHIHIPVDKTSNLNGLEGMPWLLCTDSVWLNLFWHFLLMNFKNPCFKMIFYFNVIDVSVYFFKECVGGRTFML